MHTEPSSPAMIRAALGMLVILLLSPFLGRAQEKTPGAAEAPRIWWNQPRFYSALVLTVDQRHAMDELLALHLEARREKGRSVARARVELARAAEAGEWDEAAAARVRLGEAARELALVEGALLIDVLRQLTAKQRVRLGEDFPLVLKRPWLLGGFGGQAKPGR